MGDLGTIEVEMWLVSSNGMLNSKSTVIVAMLVWCCCIVVCIGFANPRLLDLWLEKKALW